MLQYATWCVWLSVSVWFFSSLVCASTHVLFLFYSCFCHSLFCYSLLVCFFYPRSLQVYDRRHVKTFKEEDKIDTKTETLCIGTIPIMVNSSFCHLHELTELELVSKGQCSFDVGGYFIIKGSEKLRLDSPDSYFLGCKMHH